MACFTNDIFTTAAVLTVERGVENSWSQFGAICSGCELLCQQKTDSSVMRCLMAETGGFVVHERGIPRGLLAEKRKWVGRTDAEERMMLVSFGKRRVLMILMWTKICIS